jgi:hypothetical protein
MRLADGLDIGHLPFSRTLVDNVRVAGSHGQTFAEDRNHRLGSGHRVAAINLAQQAIDQTNQGIQFGGPL